MGGIQRGKRVLEDKLNLVLVTPEGSARRQVDGLAVEQDLARGRMLLAGEELGDSRLAYPLSPTRAMTAPR